MIVLITDFGFEGPYLGQMKAVIAQKSPTVPVIDLFADIPAFSAKASAYLLSAYMEFFPAKSVFLSVVDPGVGSDRKPVVVRAFDKWFVGPDNGLFELVLRRDSKAEAWHIEVDQEVVSASFHGRDVFAPVAADLADDILPAVMTGLPTDQLTRMDWPDDLAEIIYIDVFGNCITGVRADQFQADGLYVRGVRIPLVKTFSDVPASFPLIYANANGLLEIAVNQGRADEQLQLAIGDRLNLMAG